MKICFCGSSTSRCIKCGKRFRHGEASECDELPCQQEGLVCDGCGWDVAASRKGVLDDHMLIPYEELTN
jgi:hypothetical protein